MNISSDLMKRTISALSTYRNLLNIMGAGQGMQYNPYEMLSVSGSISELIGELKESIPPRKDETE